MTKTPDRPLRERVRTYNSAAFPNYPAPDTNGYPARVDVSRRLAMFSATSPDYYETFRPKLDGPNEPFKPGSEPGTFVANEAYKDSPGAMLRLGNLSRMANASVRRGAARLAAWHKRNRLARRWTSPTCGKTGALALGVHAAFAMWPLVNMIING